MNTQRHWKLESGNKLELLTPEELKTLPPETRIYSIMGNSALISDNPEGPDFDTRGGLAAWGKDIYPKEYFVEEKK